MKRALFLVLLLSLSYSWAENPRWEELGRVNGIEYMYDSKTVIPCGWVSPPSTKKKQKDQCLPASGGQEILGFMFWVKAPNITTDSAVVTCSRTDYPIGSIWQHAQGKLCTR